MVARRRVALASARKAAGYTQEALADALHVDRSSVIRWEAGRYSPVPYLWPKLAKLLGVSRERLQELFADPDSRTSDANRRELLRLLGMASAEVAVPPLLTGLSSDEQDLRTTHSARKWCWIRCLLSAVSFRHS